MVDMDRAKEKFIYKVVQDTAFENLPVGALETLANHMLDSVQEAELERLPEHFKEDETL